MDPMLDFTGKVALITGAASGFGKLLAAELGKRGARLVLGDINMDACLLYTSPSPRDRQKSRMPSSA